MSKTNWLPTSWNKKNKIEKEVALIGDSVKRIRNDAKKMGTALATLNNNVALIDQTIEESKNANYEKPKAFIDSLSLDEEYKNSLKKELEESKTDALRTLLPIKNASEKIRGNMAVSMIKYRSMVKSLTAQKNVIESGMIQVEAIDRAKQMGAFSNEKIEELIERAESINKVTKNAVLDWNSSSKTIKNSFQDMDGDKDILGIFDTK